MIPKPRHKENKKRMGLFQVLILPDHIAFYYELSAGASQAKDFPLDVNLLSFRLTGKFQADVKDPLNTLPPVERQISSPAPTAHRGGHPSCTVTVQALSDGKVLCLFPKDELKLIMPPDDVVRYTNAPPYTLLHNFKN